MATKSKAEDVLEDFVAKYVHTVRDGFYKRWSSVIPEIYSRDAQECIGGLLSRQAVLTIEMAVAPSTWNGHVAPLFLRCMIDAHITLAWILESPVVRSERYIKYGLGQEKLFIEYLVEAASEEPATYGAESLRKMIDVRKAWLNSQLSEWATEVNVGSWSGVSTREMAKEIGRESIYKHAYVPFSSPPGDAGPRVMKPGHDEAAAGCRGCGSAGGKAAELTSFSVVVPCTTCGSTLQCTTWSIARIRCISGIWYRK